MAKKIGVKWTKLPQNLRTVIFFSTVLPGFTVIKTWILQRKATKYFLMQLGNDKICVYLNTFHYLKLNKNI